MSRHCIIVALFTACTLCPLPSFEQQVDALKDKDNAVSQRILDVEDKAINCCEIDKNIDAYYHQIFQEALYKDEQFEEEDDYSSNNFDLDDKAMMCYIDDHKINLYYRTILNSIIRDDIKDYETLQAQEDGADKRPSKIQSLKIAYLSSKLNLTVEESQTFWPIYNEYVDEIRKLKDEQDEIVKDEKVLSVRKKYKENFEKSIGVEKTNNLYKAEKEFKKLMQESLIMQKMQKGGPHQPMPPSNK